MSRIGGQFGPSPGARAPDLTVPVLGYRGWSIDLKRGMLRSTLAQVLWDAPECWTRCIKVATLRPNLLQRLKHPHRAPGHLCSCGLYAHHDRRNHGSIGGAVICTGRMEVHHDGLRAEHQRVVALADPGEDTYYPTTRQLVASIAAEWGVPFVRPSELEGVALEWGEPMPESLRPA